MTFFLNPDVTRRNRLERRRDPLLLKQNDDLYFDILSSSKELYVYSHIYRLPSRRDENRRCPPFTRESNHHKYIAFNERDGRDDDDDPLRHRTAAGH